MDNFQKKLNLQLYIRVTLVVPKVRVTLWTILKKESLLYSWKTGENNGFYFVTVEKTHSDFRVYKSDSKFWHHKSHSYGPRKLSENNKFYFTKNFEKTHSDFQVC